MTGKSYRKSLLSVGLAALSPNISDASASVDLHPAAGPKDSDQTPMIDVFRLDHQYTLAQHRSHSSHRSHQSHRSGSGGSYRPAPAYTPPAPSRTTRSSLYAEPVAGDALPAAAPDALKSAPEDFEEHVALVQKVQAMLFARGLFEGDIDGALGLDTRDAIIKFETDAAMPVTGRLTRRLVDALDIKLAAAFDAPTYLKTLPGNSAKFKRIVQDVQVVLYLYGYYNDVVDGMVGPRTKAAISGFQRDYVCRRPEH